MDKPARRRTLCGGILLSAACAMSSLADAQASGPDVDAALSTSQAAITRQLGEYQFVDQRGQVLRLSDLRGKPVVLSLVYTSCYEICSGLTLHLRDVAKVARRALGPGSFSILTVGFDTSNDTPSRMRLYAKERGVETPGWYFVSTDAATIERLARDVGFTYRRSPKGLDHITQTTIIDGAGRVMVQVYGQDFYPTSLVDPLKRLVRGQELASGTFAGLARSVKLFCTIYDSASGRYRFDYSIIADLVAGILALGMVAVVLGMAWRNVR
jgi:protein SCO1/2